MLCRVKTGGRTDKREGSNAGKQNLSMSPSSLPLGGSVFQQRSLDEDRVRREVGSV